MERLGMGSLGLLVLLALPVVCLGDDQVGSFFVNSKVKRSIDVTGQLAKHSLHITFKQEGARTNTAYYLAFSEREAAHLAHIGAKDGAGNVLAVSPAPAIKVGEGAVHYKVDLGPQRVEQGPEGTLQLQIAFSRTMRPLPAAIAQDDAHLVVYEGNHFWHSPYPSDRVWTEVVHKAISIEGHSQEPAPTEVKDGSVTFGPYTGVAPYSFAPLSVHFASKGSFLTATASERELEVSHWGSVAVVESMELVHTGAALKGFFSRYDFQNNPAHCPSAVRLLHARVPASASGLYYRDEIGNISSSHVREDGGRIVIDMMPRFPLFGGWKTAFSLGYSLPLGSVLERDARDGSCLRLSVDFGLSLESLHAERHTVRVVLPEGATDISVQAPFDVDERRDVKMTYLDTTGRPVVVLTRVNVVSGVYEEPVLIFYRFSWAYMVGEPMLCVAGFFALFVLLIGKMRLEAEEPLQDLVARFRSLHTKRRKERALMASKWTEYHMKTQDKAALKVARDKCKQAMQRLAVEGEALAEDCLRERGKDDALVARVRTANKLEGEMAELRGLMYSVDVSGAEAEGYAVRYKEMQEKADKTLELL